MGANELVAKEENSEEGVVPESLRIRVLEDRGQLRIEIAPARRLRDIGQEILLLLILTLLAGQFTQHLRSLAGWINWVIALSFFAFLLVLVAMALARLVWFAFGHEEIVLRGGTLRILRRLGYVIWSRVFTVTEIRDLRVFRPAVAGVWAAHIYRVFEDSLAFRYKDGTCRFADRISQQQAKELLKKFSEWLPDVTWTPVLGIN